jgi:hypothetical protein
MLSSLKDNPLAHWLLRTYPRTWRARYGDEFMAVLEQGLTWRGAVDVLFGALDAWVVELLSTIRGPHGVAAKAVAAYVSLLLVAFIVLRVALGPGRLDVGLVWALGYGVGYVALCLVMKTRQARSDASA